MKLTKKEIGLIRLALYEYATIMEDAATSHSFTPGNKKSEREALKRQRQDLKMAEDMKAVLDKLGKKRAG